MATAGVADCGLELPLSRTKFTSRILSPEDWTFESEIRRAQRLASTGRETSRESAEMSLRDFGAEPSPHMPLSSPKATAMRFPEAFESPAATLIHRSDSRLAWMTILVGFAAFTYGLTLLALSFVEGQSDKWRFGMPIMLLGQFGLLIGIVIKLTMLQRSHRTADRRLQNVDLHLCALSHEQARQQLI